MDIRRLVLCAASLMLMVGCRTAGDRARRYYRTVPPPVPPSTSTRPVTSTRPAPIAAAGVSGEAVRMAAITSRVQQTVTASGAVTSSSTSASSGITKQTNAVTGVYRLKVGDPVVVYLRGIPGAPGGEQQIENIVGEDGYIQLPYISNVNVLNMTTTEAQEVIRNAYLDQRIYKQITVNVVVPARSYYIRGEVRHPGRYSLVGTVTVLQAVAAAGGYTEFASRSVEIYRGDKRIELNMRQIEKHPELDRVIEPGDIIVVHRSIF